MLKVSLAFVFAALMVGSAAGGGRYPGRLSAGDARQGLGGG